MNRPALPLEPASDSFGHGRMRPSSDCMLGIITPIVRCLRAQPSNGTALRGPLRVLSSHNKIARPNTYIRPLIPLIDRDRGSPLESKPTSRSPWIQGLSYSFCHVWRKAPPAAAEERTERRRVKPRKRGEKSESTPLLLGWAVDDGRRQGPSRRPSTRLCVWGIEVNQWTLPGIGIDRPSKHKEPRHPRLARYLHTCAHPPNNIRTDPRQRQDAMAAAETVTAPKAPEAAANGTGKVSALISTALDGQTDALP